MLVDQIARETGVSADRINLIISTASRRYKSYTVPKRTGGVRVINHPARPLKFLQRWIVRNFLVHLPVHESVLSYRDDVGIRRNAEVHVENNYLLRMDFADFFPSIKGDDIRRLLLANIENPPFVFLKSEDIDVIVRISCRNDALTIGAPSSPSISNAVLYGFDEFVSKECVAREVKYTRYADDISFSTNRPNVLSEIHAIVDAYLGKQKSPRLKLNKDKTSFTSKKRRRMVTGLVLTSDQKISIGRDKKREIKTLCHKFSKNELAVDRVSYLRGYLSFVHAVEPAFIDRLREKFGGELVEEIMDMTPVSRK